MVEPLLHFAVPFASLRAMGVNWRRSLFASALALTPDLDVLFHVHRSLSHSLVVLAIVVLQIFLVMRKDRTARGVLLAAIIGLISHLVLDLFGDFTPLLWPAINQSLWLSVDLSVHIGSQPAFSGWLRLLAKPTVLEPFESFDGPILTATGVGISLALLTPTLLENFTKRRSAPRTSRSSG